MVAAQSLERKALTAPAEECLIDMWEALMRAEYERELWKQIAETRLANGSS